MKTSVEKFQEILQRYSAINRREAIAPAFDTLQGLVDEVFPVEMSDVETASSILEKAVGIAARDALHVAVMRRYQVKQIMSFD